MAPLVIDRDGTRVYINDRSLAREFLFAFCRDRKDADSSSTPIKLNDLLFSTSVSGASDVPDIPSESVGDDSVRFSTDICPGDVEEEMIQSSTNISTEVILSESDVEATQECSPGDSIAEYGTCATLSAINELNIGSDGNGISHFPILPASRKIVRSKWRRKLRRRWRQLQLIHSRNRNYAIVYESPVAALEAPALEAPADPAFENQCGYVDEEFYEQCSYCQMSGDLNQCCTECILISSAPDSGYYVVVVFCIFVNSFVPRLPRFSYSFCAPHILGMADSEYVGPFKFFFSYRKDSSLPKIKFFY